MKNLARVFASVVVALSLTAVGSEVVSASTITVAPLDSAKMMPKDSSFKKGEKIMVIVKDTKKQTVSVYNANAQKTNKTVKMGNEYTVKAVKHTNGKQIVKVAANKWLNTKDVTED